MNEWRKLTTEQEFIEAQKNDEEVQGKFYTSPWVPWSGSHWVEVMQFRARPITERSELISRLRRYAGDVCLSTNIEMDAADLIEVMEAALLWTLYHHQGGSSHIGQPIRKLLGLGQHDHLSKKQIEIATAFGKGGEAHESC